jgi:hypothetical protein
MVEEFFEAAVLCNALATFSHAGRIYPLHFFLTSPTSMHLYALYTFFSGAHYLLKYLDWVIVS